MPGMIDDQVHFREPGLTNKGDLATESAAAAAGGITSFMDMPNVNPQTTTREALAAKYAMAEHRCTANYGFHFGATNRNIEEIKALQVGESAGIKAFMGASTGDMLVDDPVALDRIFEFAPVIVLTHCEDSPTIWDNEAKARDKFGENVPLSEHPRIRSADACLKSSSMAVDLARRHDALLHVLHLTTAIEMALFSKAHRSEKRITAEVCVHHLWFDESRYEDLGTRIKCNPAIKTAEDRQALVKALNDGRIDVIARPRTAHVEREEAKLFQGASRFAARTARAAGAVRPRGSWRDQPRADRRQGLPCARPIFSVWRPRLRARRLVRRSRHRRPGSAAAVDKSSLLAKCHWSPFEGHEFSATIDTTIVNGEVVYRDGELTKEHPRPASGIFQGALNSRPV